MLVSRTGPESKHDVTARAGSRSGMPLISMSRAFRRDGPVSVTEWPSLLTEHPMPERMFRISLSACELLASRWVIVMVLAVMAAAQKKNAASVKSPLMSVSSGL